VSPRVRGRRGASRVLPLAICAVSLAVVLGVAFAMNVAPGASSPPSLSRQSTNPDASASQSSSTTTCATTRTYFVAYNTTTGKIITMSVGQPPSLGSSGIGQIDITCDPNLPAITTNGYLNAFYVDLQTKELTLIPGVTFSSDYRQAYYDGQPIINGTSIPIPSQTATTSLTTSSASSAKALDFTMTLNSSSVVQGHAVAVQMSLYNTLNETNDVASADDWQLSNQSELSNSSSFGPGACSDGMGPFRVLLLTGFYDSSNYSSGTPLSIFPWPANSPFNFCYAYIPDGTWLGAPSWLFQPENNNATISPNSLPETVPMNLTVLLRPMGVALPVGQYTVVCGDEWGALQIAHFVVEPA